MTEIKNKNIKRPLTAMVCGGNPVSHAFGLICELLGLKLIKEDADAIVDLLLMADSDKFSLSDVRSHIGGTTQIIYLEDETASHDDKHDLYFLTRLCITYKIPLKEFSILEFTRIIKDIEKKKTDTKYTPPKSTPLIDNIGKVLSLIAESRFNSLDLTEYLNNQKSYIERLLHPSVKSEEYLEDIKLKLIKFDHLSSLISVPKDLHLNILVVENKPDEIVKDLIELKEHFNNIKFYLVGPEFDEFRGKVNRGERDNYQSNEKKLSFFELGTFNFDEIDLIFQDIFLAAGGVSGSDFASLYFNIAPQAMVFFLTSMDIETLAASGYDEKVDRLIGKNRIKGIMKYYYDRFHELYGPLLWPVFVNSKQRGAGNLPSIADRNSVRKLLGNIRTWTMEPGILFHGYALPEMVDHAFKHTAGLWNMANRILGPFLERKSDAMKEKDKILLSLAIWLHDVGHRGDEHHYKSIEIRENHGSISESLILSHYDAFGLGWLKDFCSNGAGSVCDGAINRNKKNGCFGNKICPLREIGLVCRYHQSTAPLKGNKLSKLLLKMKRPSPYCIVGMQNFKTEIKEPNYKTHIDKWLDTTKDFDWFSFDIRTLDDFANKKLINLAGLLRWLDALHTHNEKVGSSTQLKSFLSYLQMRKTYCEKKAKEIKKLLDNTDAGTEAYLELLAELMNIDTYSQLLDVQWIHLWRSGAVKDLNGGWFWGDSGRWEFRVVFDFFEKDPLESFMKIKKIKEKLRNYLREKPGQNELTEFHDLWREHVGEEVIRSEIKSQIEKKVINGETIKALPYFETYFSGIELSYWYKNGNNDPKKIEIKVENDKKEPKLKVRKPNSRGKKKKGLIIDCDPGCDDAMALLLAIRSNDSPYDEIHITTVAGNVPVERTTHNAIKIATVAKYGFNNKPAIRVYKGSAISLMGKSPNVTSVHGRDGLGEVPLKIYPPVDGIKVKMQKQSAVEFLRDFNDKSNVKKYDLVCTGPLTNLATALSLSREPQKLLNVFERIVIMGGAFNCKGNITPTAEFNFFFDPVAVQILLDTIKNSDNKEKKIETKIVFVPLNITEKVQLSMKEINEDVSLEDPVGKWTLCMLQKYFYFHSLSANEMNEECTKYKCSHDKLSECLYTEETYEGIRSKIKKANLIGKSGIDTMPRFCYLHDPLALWYAMKSNEDNLKDCYIKIHTDNDEMRGTVIVLDDEDSKPYTKGTKVSYLSPDNLPVSYIAQFKDALLDACGLNTKADPET